MFTGIVEELGEVVRREPTSTGARLTINGPLVISDAENGDSIAVNGVCLTVAGQDRHAASFVADLMTETLDRTTLGQLGVGDQVNLERAATLGTRLGGHPVQGHIDGVGSVTGRTAGERVDITVGVPAGLTRYLVEKGSITVDGVSLTVVSVGDTWFSVSLIPTTLRETTFGTRAVGDHVNLEVDVIAKYVERLVRHADSEVTA